METIKVKIDFQGEITLNNECVVTAPLEIVWFPDNDLIIETPHEKIVVNTRESFTVITPQVAQKELTPINDVNLKLVQNNVAKYLIVDGKVAYKLPRS